MDLGFDPVDCERHQAHVARRFEAFHRLHQADVAFLDQVGVRQPVTQVAACNRNHQPQVGEHQLARRLQVVVLTQPQRERVLAFRAEQRHAVDRLDIGLDAAGGNRRRKRHRQGHRGLHGRDSLARRILALEILEC